MKDNIRKAEEWAAKLKEQLHKAQNREYVERHIELLEWLIREVKHWKRGFENENRIARKAQNKASQLEEENKQLREALKS